MGCIARYYCSQNADSTVGLFTLRGPADASDAIGRPHAALIEFMGEAKRRAAPASKIMVGRLGRSQTPAVLRLHRCGNAVRLLAYPGSADPQNEA